MGCSRGDTGWGTRGQGRRVRAPRRTSLFISHRHCSGSFSLLTRSLRHFSQLSHITHVHASSSSSSPISCSSTSAAPVAASVSAWALLWQNRSAQTLPPPPKVRLSRTTRRRCTCQRFGLPHSHSLRQRCSCRPQCRHGEKKARLGPAGPLCPPLDHGLVGGALFCRTTTCGGTSPPSAASSVSCTTRSRRALPSARRSLSPLGGGAGSASFPLTTLVPLARRRSFNAARSLAACSAFQKRLRQLVNLFEGSTP